MQDKAEKTTQMNKAETSLNKHPETPQSSLKKVDKYRISELIAKGGMASIFIAKDSNCRRKVALKVMKNADQQKDEIIHRFIEEAQIAAQLDHPNILPVYDLTVDAQGNPFYAMKLVDGLTLEEILSKIKKKDPETVRNYPLSRLLQIFIKICNAMSFAVDRNVVHRDLKPENIMIGPFGEVFVMDWGIAKVIDKDGYLEDSPEQDSRVIERLRMDESFNINTTIQGQILGTPGFMAPEQVFDSSAADFYADIYALGGILYNMLTLLPPHSEIELRPLMKSKVGGHIPAPEKRASDESVDLLHMPGKRIPSSLSAVVQKAMALNPVERYASPNELENDIQAYLDGYATQAEGANQWRLLQLLFLRHKRLGFSLSILICLTLFYLIISSFKLQYAESEKETATNYASLTEKQVSQSLNTLANLRVKMNKIRAIAPEIEDRVYNLMKSNSHKRALELIDTYFEIDTTEKLYVYKAEILIKSNKPSQLKRTLKRALKSYPDSEQLLRLSESIK